MRALAGLCRHARPEKVTLWTDDTPISTARVKPPQLHVTPKDWAKRGAVQRENRRVKLTRDPEKPVGERKM